MANTKQNITLGLLVAGSGYAATHPSTVKPVFEGLARLVGNVTHSGYAHMDESTVAGYCALATIALGAALYKNLGYDRKDPPSNPPAGPPPGLPRLPRAP